MILLAGFLGSLIAATACWLLGYRAGKARAYREWLLALLDEEPVDFDTMLVGILQSIQDEKSA